MCKTVVDTVTSILLSLFMGLGTIHAYNLYGCTDLALLCVVVGWLAFSVANYATQLAYWQRKC